MAELFLDLLESRRVTGGRKDVDLIATNDCLDPRALSVFRNRKYRVMEAAPKACRHTDRIQEVFG
jgi:hypothetical protein